MRKNSVKKYYEIKCKEIENEKDSFSSGQCQKGKKKKEGKK